MTIIYLSTANIIISIISIVVLSFLYFENKHRVHGLSLWILSHILFLLGFLFDVSRVIIYEWIAILISNPLQCVSFIVLYLGFGKFLEKPVKLKVTLFIFGIYMLGLIYFTVFNDELAGRQVFLFLYGLYINLTIAYFLLKNSTKVLGKTIGFTSLVLFLSATISAIGLGLLIVSPSSNSYLDSNPKDIMTLVSFIMIIILLTYSQIMLVSARLLDNVLVSERKFSLVFENSQLPILITKLPYGVIHTTNASFERLVGYTSKELIGKTTTELDLWDDPDVRQKLVNDLKRDSTIKDAEVVLKTKDHRRLTCLLSSSFINMQNEDLIISDIHDVTDSVNLREDLKHLATHDHLTGLANRSLFYDRFEQAKAMASRRDYQLSIILMDMDKLKDINDLYGHIIGDKALIHLSNQINSVLRKMDTFARFGGDEFCIILNEMTNLEGTLFVIKRIQEVLLQPMIIDEISLPVTVSMGISLYPQDGSTINELIKKADKAMYYVKSNHRNDYKFYSDLEKTDELKK